MGCHLPSFERFGEVLTEDLRVSVCLPPNKEVSNIFSCGHLAHVHVAFEPRIVRGMSLCKDISQGVGRELVMDIFALCELQREDLGIVRQATPQIS